MGDEMNSSQAQTQSSMEQPQQKASNQPPTTNPSGNPNIPQQMGNNNSETLPQAKKMKWWIWVLIVLGVLVVSAVVYYLFF